MTAIVQGFFGITPLSPGYEYFEVRPQPASVQSANITVPALVGFINASFVVPSAKEFDLYLGIPANSFARACLPLLGSSSKALVVDGWQVEGTINGMFVCVEVGSAGWMRKISRIVE